MRNKATGAWVLHEETRELSLDHFILFSSAANLVATAVNRSQCSHGFPQRSGSYAQANGAGGHKY